MHRLSLLLFLFPAAAWAAPSKFVDKASTTPEKLVRTSTIDADLFSVATNCGLISGKCGVGTCVGKSYCTGGTCSAPFCYSPKSQVSQILCQGASLPPACLHGAPRAMWVWQPSTVTNLCARQKLLQFALSRHIDTLYVQSASLLDSPGTHAALAAFIAAADALGIAV